MLNGSRALVLTCTGALFNRGAHRIFSSQFLGVENSSNEEMRQTWVNLYRVAGSVRLWPPSCVQVVCGET